MRAISRGRASSDSGLIVETDFREQEWKLRTHEEVVVPAKAVAAEVS